MSDPLPGIHSDSIRKILLIKLRATGDVVLSTVVLPNLREAFPDARIDFLVERSCRDVLAGNDLVDNVVVFEKRGMQGLKILFTLLKEQYDLVLDLFGNPRSALMTFASRARYRVGYEFRGRSYAYNILVKPRGAEVHNVEFNLDALRRIDVPIVEKTLAFPIAEEHRIFAETEFRRMGLDSGLVIGINPGTNRPTERWPPEKFATLGKMLRENLNSSVLVFWGPNERPIAESIVDIVGEGAVIAPTTNLKQLGAMFQRCTLVVSNDSGPMHIAASLGVPTVGIYGPVNPLLQGPYGENTAYVNKEGLACLGCNLDKYCPIGNVCMTDLTPGEVLIRIEALLRKCNVIKG